MISVLDWAFPIGNKAKAYSVRDVIGDKLALTATDNGCSPRPVSLMLDLLMLKHLRTDPTK